MALHEFTRPEDPQEEAHFYVRTVHLCAVHARRAAQVGEDKANAEAALLYPVGFAGFEMPREVPFDVQPTEPCGLCGQSPTLHAMWKGKLVIDLGAKPKGEPA